MNASRSSTHTATVRACSLRRSSRSSDLDSRSAWSESSSFRNTATAAMNAPIVPRAPTHSATVPHSTSDHSKTRSLPERRYVTGPRAPAIRRQGFLARAGLLRQSAPWELADPALRLREAPGNRQLAAPRTPGPSLCRAPGSAGEWAPDPCPFRSRPSWARRRATQGNRGLLEAVVGLQGVDGLTELLERGFDAGRVAGEVAGSHECAVEGLVGGAGA